MFSTDFIFRQQENLVDNQKSQAGCRPLRNKILLPSWEMLKLGEHEIMKTSKKGDFGNFLNPFCDFPPKRVPRIVTFSLHVAPF